MVGLESRLVRSKTIAQAAAGTEERTGVNGANGGDSPAKGFAFGNPEIRPQRDAARMVAQAEVIRKIKQDYTRDRKEPGKRGLDSIHGIVKELMEGKDMVEAMNSVARAIYSQFNIKEVSIGLKGSNGKYRYVAMHGLRTENWAAHQLLEYEERELLDPDNYKWTDISRQTKFFLAEDNPYTEEEALTRTEHLMMKSKRRTPEESIEGDYLDIFMLGPNDEILGWIETGGTWDSRIPDAGTIRSLEALASVIALSLVLRPPK